MVVDILPGSMSHKAGLHPGDLILKMNRMQVTNSQDLKQLLQDKKPGEPIVFYLEREKQKLFVALATR